MARPKRGKTIKLSIRLSTAAKQQIQKAAANLGVSSSGVILFELARLLKNPPSISELETMENDITLERDHFVITINEGLSERVNGMAEDYNMKKNRLIGYIISNHFESQAAIKEQKKTDPKKFMLQLNSKLGDKVMEYAERNYVPLPALVSYSVLQGESEELPTFESGESVKIFTNIPEYVLETIKDEADLRSIPEHFYTSSCLFKQFMTEKGRFFE